MNDPILDGLNPQQLAAVTHGDAPLLILAGAGSGKTKSLTHRIARIIRDGARGQNILAVTFTNKAAGEMKERIARLLAGNNLSHERPMVGTFHAICARILRQNIEELPLNYTKNFTIYDTSEQHAVVKRLLKNGFPEEIQRKFRTVHGYISGAKNELLTPNDFDNLEFGGRMKEAAKRIYSDYQAELRKQNAVDFDDLLLLTVKLFKTCPSVLAAYNQRWQWVMVDEYQDTNVAQYELIKLLCPHGRLTVIGDDSQSIYKFRGADFRNILNFEVDFGGATVVYLEQNYRSTAAILANANAVIGQNQTGRKKNLWTEKQDGERVQVVRCGDQNIEGKFIAERMRELKKMGHEYAEMAVLCRTNALGRTLEESLLRAGVPYKIVGGTKFLERAEIKDIVSYLRLINNPSDDAAFDRIINVPSRKLGAKTLQYIDEYARTWGVSKFESLARAEEMVALPAKKQQELLKFYAMMKTLQEEKDGDLSALLDDLIEAIDYYKYLDDGTDRGVAKQENVREVYSMVGEFAEAGALTDMLEHVMLMTATDKTANVQDAVTLMTIHASKGLEFSVVFLPAWENGVFPSEADIQDVDEMEEARRLAYVAITRAKELLTITRTDERMLYGRTERRPQSVFIDELSGEHTAFSEFGVLRSSGLAGVMVNTDELYTPVAEAPKSMSEAVFGGSSEFRVGQKVKTEEHGEGSIILIRDGVLQIAFKGRGIKRVMPSVTRVEVA